MILKSILLIASMILAGSGSAAGQQGSAPKVGKLGFYVGKWAGRGLMRDHPAAVFKGIHGRETCRWAAGGAAVLCEEKETGPGGGWNGVYLLGYDERQDSYTLFGIEEPGTIVRGTGKLEKGVWKWTAESVAAGRSSPARYTLTGDGRKSRMMAVEAPDASGKWFTVANHRYTRSTQ
jgi:hypothetical protein